MRSTAPWTALAASVALSAFLPGPSPAADPPTAPRVKVTLKSDEVVEGYLARDLGDSIIIRNRNGLRSIPKSEVEKQEEVADAPPADDRGGAKAAKDAKDTKDAKDVKESKDAKETKDGKDAKDAKAPPPPTKKAPAKDAKDAKDDKGGGGDSAPTIKVLPDKRLDDARGGGPPPVVEVIIGGTVDGKPLNAADPFAFSRAAHFFEVESRPRFEVLVPAALRAKAKAAAGKGARGPAEYQAKLSAETSMIDIKFYDTPVIKKFRTQVSFQLVRLSDKKMVIELTSTEDADGDPDQRERSCRAGFESAVRSTIDRLKNLKPFGGMAGGTDI